MGGGKMKLLLSIAMIAMMSGNAMAGDKVIYGKDDRKDLYEVTNPLYKKLADSTVVLVRKTDVQASSNNTMTIRAQSFQQVMSVCKTERFSDQPSGGFCSGTLIAKNMVLTAGHCITNQSGCQGVNFVFGYGVKAKGQYPKVVPADDVVGCKNILYREQNGNGADFAIIELTRPITQHAPAKLAVGRRSQEISKGTKLVMIGHPAGLPTKVEDGGKVRDSSSTGFFVANTDSYGGNSGSGVFNQQSGELEGVLVRGETDYVSTGSCYVSNVVPEDGGRGEDVTKVSSVLSHLPSTLATRH